MILTVTPWILTMGVVEKWRKRKCFIWSKFRNGQKTAFGFMLYGLSCRDWGEFLKWMHHFISSSVHIIIIVNLQYEIYQKQWPKNKEKTEWLRSLTVWLYSSIHNIKKNHLRKIVVTVMGNIILGKWLKLRFMLVFPSFKNQIVCVCAEKSRTKYFQSTSASCSFATQLRLSCTFVCVLRKKVISLSRRGK